MTLKEARYISFSTLKRNGDWVATPVWFAPGGKGFYIFSAGAAGKVKRLRNFSQCRVAPCTFSGTPTGEVQGATAWLVDDAQEEAAALAALRAKYGLQMWITDLGSKLTGKFRRRQYIGFRLD